MRRGLELLAWAWEHSVRGALRKRDVRLLFEQLWRVSNVLFELLLLLRSFGWDGNVHADVCL